MANSPLRQPARPGHFMTGIAARATVRGRPAGPDEAFTPQLVSRVLAIAARAPSLHNTQPWRWRLRRDRLELRADRDRQLVVADPDGHSLRVSCGAALAMAELAFAGEGLALHVERLPDPDQPDLLAILADPCTRACTTSDRDLLKAAHRRYSERRPFRSLAVPDHLIEALRAAAGGESVNAHFPLREDEKLNLAVAVSWADRVELRDAAYIAEMRRWLRDADVHSEGVPGSAVPQVQVGHPRHTDIPLRDFEVGVSGREQIQADVDEHPLIVILLTGSDSPPEQLAAGESMLRLMLQAERTGLASCPLSQAVDRAAFRTRVRSLMGWIGYPQMMLRIGYPPSGTPGPGRSPRRPVVDQLEVAGSGGF
jgi:nitroreductase